jgi:hypothetical protein
LYTSHVFGLRPFALFYEIKLLLKKKIIPKKPSFSTRQELQHPSEHNPINSKHMKNEIPRLSQYHS